jgi:hypothetical protein
LRSEPKSMARYSSTTIGRSAGSARIGSNYA